jgi:hypothetical protein
VLHVSFIIQLQFMRRTAQKYFFFDETGGARPLLEIYIKIKQVQILTNWAQETKKVRKKIARITQSCLAIDQSLDGTVPLLLE